MSKIPKLFELLLGGALVGEIYPEIRGICCKYDNGELLMRYYFDREPTEEDYENTKVIYSEFDAALGYPNQIKSAEIECIYSNVVQSKLDNLDGFVYLRREY